MNPVSQKYFIIISSTTYLILIDFYPQGYSLALFATTQTSQLLLGNVSVFPIGGVALLTYFVISLSPVQADNEQQLTYSFGFSEKELNQNDCVYFDTGIYQLIYFFHSLPNVNN